MRGDLLGHSKSNGAYESYKAFIYHAMDISADDEEKQLRVVNFFAALKTRPQQQSMHILP